MKLFPNFREESHFTPVAAKPILPARKYNIRLCIDENYRHFITDAHNDLQTVSVDSEVKIYNKLYTVRPFLNILILSHS